ncbi:tellurite resistance TerB family protein [Rubellimicrobium aerolatum]|uniref:Tellurite resistance TerB family protein n=1 Tax=Rubellimicrobium aerolatum TaxID=490979 RepID=A0ABW0SEX7_9RHOB|nr:TerB family tellurite resistance protein [Rubellimicrobium aerolatum]MBP1806488.1 tellurite resistance protein TerB [Rubellimicrobium aerolatum]
MFGFLNGKKARNDLKAKLADSANRLSGRLDFLQGAVSLAALVMAADGEIEAAERDMLARSLRNNDTLNAAYTGAQIDEATKRALAKAEQGRTGKKALWSEVEDLKGDPDAETVILMAMDVADSDGDMEPAEQKVLRDACDRLGLSFEALV